MKTKRNKILCRGVKLVLLLVLALGCLWPCLTTNAAEFSIDGSGFQDPTIDHQTLYIWRRGLPEAQRQADIGYQRDILITWDGKYYLRCTTDFMHTLVNMYPMTNGGSHKLAVSHLSWAMHYSPWNWNGVDWDYAHEITWQNGRYPYDDSNGWNKGNRYYPNGYPHGWYMYYVDYKTSTGTVSHLPFSFSSLNDADITATLTPINNLPFAAYAGKADGENAYGIGFYNPVFPNESRVWVASEHKIHTWNDDYWYQADRQYTYIRATLDYWTTGVGRQPFAAYGTHSLAESTWRLVPKTDKSVSIETFGKGYISKYNDDGYADNQDKDDLYHLMNTDRLFGCMAFGHEGSTFRTVGNANQWAYNYKYDYGHSNGRHPLLSSHRDEFDVFWCEDILMDYIQVPYSVQNGQVSSLDGPIAIMNTITVEEGGTLVINGWVANNGKIIVKNGGTLYIQEGACLNRLNMDPATDDHQGGGIECEGLIIVAPNAKLCGGGVDGIHLKEGSHVVNYGLVTSENFVIDQSYTIENRRDGVVFYGSGYGVTGSGMGTWNNSFSSSGYQEKGQVEPSCYTNVSQIPNAIYAN